MQARHGAGYSVLAASSEALRDPTRVGSESDPGWRVKLDSTRAREGESNPTRLDPPRRNAMCDWIASSAARAPLICGIQ